MKIKHPIGRPVLWLLCCVMLAGAAGTAGAQTPVDAQLVKAMDAMKGALTECNAKKFLECVSVTKKGSQVSGFLARTINGGSACARWQVWPRSQVLA